MLVLFSEEKGRKDQRANGHRDANIRSSQKLHSTKESSFAQSHTPSLRTAHYLSQWSNINTWAFVPIQDNSALPAQLLRAVWGSTGSHARDRHRDCITATLLLLSTFASSTPPTALNSKSLAPSYMSCYFPSQIFLPRKQLATPGKLRKASWAPRLVFLPF